MKYREHEIWLLCGDKRLEELAEEIKGNTISCYVPSVAGKVFSIAFNDQSDTDIKIKCYINGEFARAVARRRSEGTAYIQGVRKTATILEPFVFAEPTLTDDASIADNDDGIGQLGMVELQVFRVKIPGENVPFSAAQAASKLAGPGPVHERKKALGVHCVVLGKPRGAERTTIVHTVPLDDDDLPDAVFVFNCRSREILQAQGIVATPEETQPTNDRKGKKRREVTPEQSTRSQSQKRPRQASPTTPVRARVATQIGSPTAANAGPSVATQIGLPLGAGPSATTGARPSSRTGRSTVPAANRSPAPEASPSSSAHPDTSAGVRGHQSTSAAAGPSAGPLAAASTGQSSAAEATTADVKPVLRAAPAVIDLNDDEDEEMEALKDQIQLLRTACESNMQLMHTGMTNLEKQIARADAKRRRTNRLVNVKQEASSQVKQEALSQVKQEEPSRAKQSGASERVFIDLTGD
ncbi:hypothetical protein WOLCODRAFT_139889 [Wolfiporia cocos MD-104 SS10]|uniref:DUF7918 domain-containing protein n=1 Tax=Wolfiporia cocos (strain MD-104) TaxID=742152 RepID=A0A2H3IZI5_WOLCO|nr:hypothetical protein WOLCODRAFT_139889 [Wolfiporia cocos MD-104 SS10]